MSAARTWGRRTLSARARIVGGMLLLVAMALVASVIVTAAVLSERADGLAADALTHEAKSFDTYVASPTGQQQRSVRGLLARYLEDRVPDSGETFFSVIDGQAHLRSPVSPPARLDTDKAFVAEIAGLEEPTSGWRDSSQGRVRYGVIPVTMEGDPHRGALVIVQFRDVQAEPFLQSVWIYSVVGGAMLVIAGLVGWLLAGRVLAPLRLVRRTAEQISESDLHRRIPVTGRDDVARLAATFNRMLDRLETAFSGQRQFLDDAGHELRTPITVVRGHLEVAGNDPAEWRATRALVLDELDRMKRIVDDLVDLARSERPDFLSVGEVDLADLTVDVLAHARVLGDREWRVAEVAEGKVRADGQRLTQALMQLVANAVRHTSTGDTIAVGSRLTEERLLLWVSDTGRGVDPADAPYIFERFRRGSGGRRADGAGLGLSIVSSIAEAHGGVARLDDDSGSGALFVLDLPLRRPAHREGAPR